MPSTFAANLLPQKVPAASGKNTSTFTCDIAECGRSRIVPYCTDSASVQFPHPTRMSLVSRNPSAYPWSFHGLPLGAPKIRFTSHRLCTELYRTVRYGFSRYPTCNQLLTRTRTGIPGGGGGNHILTAKVPLEVYCGRSPGPVEKCGKHESGMNRG